ncbi:ATP-dependent helicase [Bacillus atrophaeus]|uniref:ATP-dependent helicase n=1 Tax=Bacillus atrophaeus TaxID=1452 RepID=UPI0022821F0E|nr:ATP-dependent helicase [Bacillus atrophaeus]MCY8807030.1 ATP-dependent helicase [Bacillus atrophaeus]
MMENVPENKVAMITFTNKAAAEMKNRVKEFTNNCKSEIQIGTFNGIFRRLYDELKKEFPFINSFGINGNTPDKGEREYTKLLSSMINKYELKKLNGSGEKNSFERIGYWTNLGFTLEDMSESIKKHYDDLEPESDTPLSVRFKNMMDEVNKIRKEKNIFIYDDQLSNLFNILKIDELSRKFVQNKFDYIFIDEFQDTNPLQMKILQLICPPNSNDTAKLIIVGDDDQSIYYFRGAEPKFIKQFDEIYHTHTSTLMTNYRSTTQIVQAGNRVIIANKGDRIEKVMNPFHKNKGDCYIKKLNNPEDEASWIINKAKDSGFKSEPFKNQPNTPNLKNSVVLYRSSGQLKSLLSELENQQLPYVIESKEDILGIFNIDLFKRDFYLWKNFIESHINEEKKQSWNNIIERTGYLFYKKSSEIKQFINDTAGFITEKVAADFVCKPNNKKFLRDTENFLKELIKIKNDPTRPLTQFINLYLSFPRSQSKIGLEDTAWIQKEFQSVKTWVGLITKYENLLKKKKEMQDQLIAYHSGELNAIYLLTIHKSKGLSFPNVFLIGLYNEGLPHKKAVLKRNVNTKELIEKADPPTTIEEERRLMYVAVTRPKENLYVTFPKMLNNKPCKRSLFLKELGLPIK